VSFVELGTEDDARIAAALEREGPLQVYALGDLDPFFRPYTRWFGWEADGVITHVALLYDEPDPPVLHALCAREPDTLRALLDAAAPDLPDRVYAHLTPSLLRPPPAGYAVASPPVPHLKLALEHRGEVMPHAVGGFDLLGPGDRADLDELYAAAYPGTWFQARMLETGRYVGRREHGRLVAVAGVHLFSPALRVAALGNVATHPEARGRGQARELCAHLCVLLAGDGIETIALNVAADNAAAIAVYRRLGFEEVDRFVEVTLSRG
jgi:ribosomal protein S18 acetylase RimI-like enzyme